MDKIRLTLFFILFISGIVQAQVNRYMVFFRDKTGTPHTISSPATFLSSRAVQRRTNQNISIVEQDLPVVPAYVNGVRGVVGVTMLYSTKWMNGVLVECPSSAKTTLEGLAYVSSVELVAPGSRPSAGRIKASRKFNDTENIAAATDIQLSMLGINSMHTAGYHGEGKLIAILDGGFVNGNNIPALQHIFNESRFDAATSFNFVSKVPNVFSGISHGLNVWSIVGAFDPGSYVGGAYKASFILFITEDGATEYRVEEYNWLFAAERADSAGVDVINTSLGYNTFDDAQMDYSKSQMDGQTAVITRAANIAASKGIAVVVSAGNEGTNSWRIITAPADSKDVFTVGSVNNLGIKVPSSSIGPTADGRIKPDVVALGSSVSIIIPNGTVSSGGGTSYAAPLVTSLVAGLWQMLPNLTVKELLDTIRNRSSLSRNPNSSLGYGIPNFSSVITATEPESSTEFATVYPNPVLSNLRITLTDPGPMDHLMITIFDSKGVRCNINSTTTNSQELLMDFSNQKSGLYLIRLQNGSHVMIHKILKIE